MIQRRYHIVLLLAALLLLCPLAAGAVTPRTVYTLAVVPSAPPVVTHTLWAPFVERLSRDTGIGFKLKIYEKMSEFERDIVSPEAPDFVFANSLQIVVAHREQGYIPLVRASGLVWVEVFVRRDSPFRAVDDLSGRRIAFVGAKNL